LGQIDLERFWGKTNHPTKLTKLKTMLIYRIIKKNLKKSPPIICCANLKLNLAILHKDSGFRW